MRGRNVGGFSVKMIFKKKKQFSEKKNDFRFGNENWSFIVTGVGPSCGYLTSPVIRTLRYGVALAEARYHNGVCKARFIYTRLISSFSAKM